MAHVLAQLRLIFYHQHPGASTRASKRCRSRGWQPVGQGHRALRWLFGQPCLYLRYWLGGKRERKGRAHDRLASQRKRAPQQGGQLAAQGQT